MTGGASREPSTQLGPPQTRLWLEKAPSASTGYINSEPHLSMTTATTVQQTQAEEREVQNRPSRSPEAAGPGMDKAIVTDEDQQAPFQPPPSPFQLPHPQTRPLPEKKPKSPVFVLPEKKLKAPIVVAAPYKSSRYLDDAMGQLHKSKWWGTSAMKATPRPRSFIVASYGGCGSKSKSQLPVY